VTNEVDRPRRISAKKTAPNIQGTRSLAADVRLEAESNAKFVTTSQSYGKILICRKLQLLHREARITLKAQIDLANSNGVAARVREANVKIL